MLTLALHKVHAIGMQLADILSQSWVAILQCATRKYGI